MDHDRAFTALRCIALPVALLLATLPVHAQSFPRWELGAGFSYANINVGSQAGTFSPANRNYYGFDLAFGYNLRRYVSLVTKVGFQFARTTAVPPAEFTKVHLENTEMLFGPQFTLRKRRTTTFANVLVGLNNTTLLLQAGTLYQNTMDRNSIALGIGGGVDVNLPRSLAIRAIHVEYVPTRRNGTWDAQFIISTGLLYRF